MTPVIWDDTELFAGPGGTTFRPGREQRDRPEGLSLSGVKFSNSHHDILKVLLREGAQTDFDEGGSTRNRDLRRSA